VNADVPVLFLDYDNVLHPCGAYRKRRGIVPSDQTARLFEFASILDALIAPYPELVFVLSTSWVVALGYERARDQLPLQSLRDRVVSATYHSRDELAPTWSEVPRGTQVLRYVSRHRLRRWLAIDDVREGFEGYKSRLVHCQEGVGLGDRAVQARFATMLATLFPAPNSNADANAD
jgi:HAD domain in Swiss Army Knife RNA repair proteins